MRYSHNDPRQDDPAEVMRHAGKYDGGRALIVLGGYSAKNWWELCMEIKPDVLITANGANSIVDNADYWICCENLGLTNKLARQGNEDAIAIMEMFQRVGARNRMVSWHSWRLLNDTRNCISIRRNDYTSWFSFREYGLGYLEGPVSEYKEQWNRGVKVNCGTVGAQCLHHAGILGCAEVHTIGFDLCFKDNERHHAYEYPLYKVDKFRSANMFTTYNGFRTQWIWIETAEFLKSLKLQFKRDGLRWTDHSDGLL